MIYISKGTSKSGLHHPLKVTRCSKTIQLSGLQAELWRKGRYEFASAQTKAGGHRYFSVLCSDQLRPLSHPATRHRADHRKKRTPSLAEESGPAHDRRRAGLPA